MTCTMAKILQINKKHTIISSSILFMVSKKWIISKCLCFENVKLLYILYSITLSVFHVLQIFAGCFASSYQLRFQHMNGLELVQGYKTRPVNNFETCFYYCAKRTRCQAFAYDETAKLCHVSSSRPTLTSATTKTPTYMKGEVILIVIGSEGSASEVISFQIRISDLAFLQLFWQSE